MGERIQWVAGVIFALAFVALLSTMNMDVLRYGSNVNNQVNNQIAVSESYELQNFDGTLVTGDTVRSAVKNQDTLYTSKLEIRIGSDWDSASVVNNADDIGLSQKYEAHLHRNANNIIDGVYFEPQ